MKQRLDRRWVVLLLLGASIVIGMFLFMDNVSAYTKTSCELEDNWYGNKIEVSSIVTTSPNGVNAKYGEVFRCPDTMTVNRVYFYVSARQGTWTGTERLKVGLQGVTLATGFNDDVWLGATGDAKNIFYPSGAGWYNILLNETATLTGGSMYSLVLYDFRGLLTNTKYLVMVVANNPTDYVNTNTLNGYYEEFDCYFQRLGSGNNRFGTMMYMISDGTTYQGFPYSTVIGTGLASTTITDIYAGNCTRQFFNVSENITVDEVSVLMSRKLASTIPTASVSYEIRLQSGSVLRSGVLAVPLESCYLSGVRWQTASFTSLGLFTNGSYELRLWSNCALASSWEAVGLQTVATFTYNQSTYQGNTSCFGASVNNGSTWTVYKGIDLQYKFRKVPLITITNSLTNVTGSSTSSWNGTGYTISNTFSSPLVWFLNTVHAVVTHQNTWTGTQMNLWVNTTGNQSGLVLNDMSSGVSGSLTYWWSALTGVNGEWWINDTHTGVSPNINLLVHNNNPGNGSHSKLFLKEDNTGLTTSVDIINKNFTDPPAEMPGPHSKTIIGTAPLNANTVWNTSTTGVYDDVHDAMAGQITPGPPYIGQYELAGEYTIMRSFLIFNTSTIPHDAVITSGYVKLYVYDDVGVVDDFNVTLQRCRQPCPHMPSLTINDYYDHGFTGDAGHTNTTGYVDDAQFNIALNAVGVSDVLGGDWKLTDTVRWALTSDRDDDAIAPTADEFIIMYGYGVDTAKWPRLILNYTIPSSSYDHIVNLTWSSNSSGSWLQYNKSYSMSNGTVTVGADNFTGVGNYWWNVSYDCNGNNSGQTGAFIFTTLALSTTVLSVDENLSVINPNPGNGTHDTNFIKKAGDITTSLDFEMLNFSNLPKSLTEETTMKGSSMGTDWYYQTFTLTRVVSLKRIFIKTDGSTMGMPFLTHNFSIVNCNVTGYPNGGYKGNTTDITVNMGDYGWVYVDFTVPLVLPPGRYGIKERISPVFGVGIPWCVDTATSDYSGGNVFWDSGGIWYNRSSWDFLFFLSEGWNDVLNISFFTNETGDGHWYEYAQSMVVSNGTVTVPFLNASGIDTYYWRMNYSNPDVSGSTDVFSFTTINVTSQLIPIPIDEKHVVIYSGFGIAACGVLCVGLTRRNRKKDEEK